MDNLNELLNYGWPACTVRIKPAPDAKPDDPWPGVETSNAKMQAALDNCVTWAAGITPPSASEVRAKISAWTAAKPTPEAVADAQAQTELENSRLVKAVALWAAQRFGVSAATARNEIAAIYKTL